MPGADTRQAACGCGRLRVTTVGDPDIVIACSCLACQRRSGSPFGLGAYFRKDAVSAEGEAQVFTRVADSGLDVSIRFCPACGNSVYWLAELRPDHYGVAGLLRRARFRPPVARGVEREQASLGQVPGRRTGARARGAPFGGGAREVGVGQGPFAP